MRLCHPDSSSPCVCAGSSYGARDDQNGATVLVFSRSAAFDDEGSRAPCLLSVPWDRPGEIEEPPDHWSEAHDGLSGEPYPFSRFGPPSEKFAGSSPAPPTTTFPPRVGDIKWATCFHSFANELLSHCPPSQDDPLPSNALSKFLIFYCLDFG